MERWRNGAREGGTDRFKENYSIDCIILYLLSVNSSNELMFAIYSIRHKIK